MSKKMDKILAEISAGELIDKITILEIKKEKISNKEKLIEVNKELVSLNKTLKKSINNESKILSFKNDLKNINLKLWDIEDKIRDKEKNKKYYCNATSALIECIGNRQQRDNIANRSNLHQ